MKYCATEERFRSQYYLLESLDHDCSSKPHRLDHHSGCRSTWVAHWQPANLHIREGEKSLSLSVLRRRSHILVYTELIF